MFKIKNILGALMLIAFFNPVQAFSQEDDAFQDAPVKKVRRRVKRRAKPSSSSLDNVSPKKVDVKSLEKKYWAPKSGKFKVIQNRTYTKTKKFHLSILPSLMLNEEYSEGFGLVAGLGYYFNDRWGLEGEFQYMSLEDNELQNAVVDLSGFVDGSRTTNYIGLTGKFMPLYAKMSWLGSKIVYFDLSFGVSLGVMSYQPRRVSGTVSAGNAVTDDLGDPQNAIALGFEVSQSFYLSKHLLIRADYKQRFFNEQVYQGSESAVSTPTDGIPALIEREERIQDSISLNLGLTYIF